MHLRDAATLLQLSTSDAVFELEQNGFSRSLAAVELDEQTRTDIYDRLRRQRLARASGPLVNPDLVERDVIASERIEGVDARAWIRRK